jgi:hypothetical protein
VAGNDVVGKVDELQDVGCEADCSEGFHGVLALQSKTEGICKVIW